MSKKSAEPKIEIEAGNVFQQLRLPNSEERLRKARLINVINTAMKRRGASRKDWADAAGLAQCDISRIQHGRSSRYSTDGLLNILSRLGIGVEIIQRRGKRGEIVIDVRELPASGHEKKHPASSAR